ncbi:MAG: hypothetical protein E6I31_06430 [Chloroflexi bacterium]|nr:MAG: hypothetical protein E6I31_06430 [Chloroflexota bacterium]
MALPRPAPARRVFRPARRVSWGTRIFALLVFLVAVGAIGAFLEVLLPQQVAKLAEMEGNELVLARKGTADVNTAVAGLWAELSPKGSMGLTAARMSEDLALAKRTERSADEALSHVQAAQAYMAQADACQYEREPQRPGLDQRGPNGIDDRDRSQVPAESGGRPGSAP